MNATYRVSLSFRRLPDGGLSNFANTVLAELYAQAAYDSPPVPEADLRASIDAFKAAKVAQADGGKLHTAAKNQCREELLDQLRNLAFYVQRASRNDLPTLLSSGFGAMSRNRTPAPLPKACVLRIVRGHSGVALVTAKSDRNARLYEVEAAEVDENGVPGPYGSPVRRSSSLSIPVAGLKPGKLYLFRLRMFGGKEGFTDWSNAVMQRVM